MRCEREQIGPTRYIARTMPRSTQDDARCTVYTFKEGLLSAIAHDLEIAVERFSIEWDDARTRIEASPPADTVWLTRRVEKSRFARSGWSAARGSRSRVVCCATRTG